MRTMDAVGRRPRPAVAAATSAAAFSMDQGRSQYSSILLLGCTSVEIRRRNYASGIMPPNVRAENTKLPRRTQLPQSAGVNVCSDNCNELAPANLEAVNENCSM